MDDLGQLADFPAILRRLVEAEIAVGNVVVEFGSSFPAPPAGAYAKLTRPVSTRPRAAGDGLTFRDRGSSLCAGEFSDGAGFYFVLEPPGPPPGEPDMDAIRAAAAGGAVAPAPQPARSAPAGLLERLRASMTIDYETWHDGVGYDLSLLEQASPAERQAIEDLLLSRAVEDWRDVEALAALGGQRCREALERVLLHGSPELQGAVLDHAPELVPDPRRTDLLVQLLADAEPFAGLDRALSRAVDFHPPRVLAALLEGVRQRDGTTAMHFAAVLLYLHGKATSPFDMEQRPYLLRFTSEDADERKAAYRELCARIGAEPRA